MAQNTAERPASTATVDTDALRIKPEQMAAKPRIATRRYWIGIHPDAPFSHDSRGGVGMTKYRGKVEYDEEGKPSNPDATRLGDILELTPPQVDVLLERIGAMVVRPGTSTPGDRVAARKLTRLGSQYEPDPRDIPLGRFIYVKPLKSEELVARDCRDSVPPCLVRD